VSLVTAAIGVPATSDHTLIITPQEFQTSAAREGRLTSNNRCQALEKFTVSGPKTDGHMKWNWIEAEIYGATLRKLVEMSTFGQENKNG
jgi:hypothetical protein